MDFIMLNCKRTKAIRRIAFSVLAGLFLLSLSSYAGSDQNKLNHGFLIKNAALALIGTEYRLNADIQFHFSKEAIKALEHGIALQIDIEVQAKKTREWLWNKKIRQKILRQKIEYHPLSDQFLITDLSTGNRHHFQNFHHAIKFLGTINSYPFLDSTVLKPEATYTAWIRVRLNTEALPTPLRLSAYISSDWQLYSPWYAWMIR